MKEYKTIDYTADNLNDMVKKGWKLVQVYSVVRFPVSTHGFDSGSSYAKAILVRKYYPFFGIIKNKIRCLVHRVFHYRKYKQAMKELKERNNYLYE